MEDIIQPATEAIREAKQVMDQRASYLMSSMLRDVIKRGTGRRARVLERNDIAGKTGTTNESRDVWYVGFTSNIVAGCYIGHDVPKPLGKGWYGGSACGPVFQDFMVEAVEKFGGGQFVVPNGGEFINMDRYSGARLPEDAEGEHVVAEYFREGEEPVFGVTFDGGFAMGGNFEIIRLDGSDTKTVTTSTGNQVKIGPKATLGTLSSGGLY